MEIYLLIFRDDVTDSSEGQKQQFRSKIDRVLTRRAETFPITRPPSHSGHGKKARSTSPYQITLSHADLIISKIRESVRIPR